MHVAIIMDGNGRWAQKRGLPRTAGHRVGAKAVRRTVEAAARSDISVLTLYAFSSDNWARPGGEVAHLMRLLAQYLRSEVAECIANGIRINVIGRRDRLDKRVLREIDHAEAATSDGNRMLLQLAIDYSATAAITRAAKIATEHESFESALARSIHSVIPRPNVDLLIRTGGEKRLSDFMLFESAYAELLFVDTLWPDFDAPALTSALSMFQQRQRRFGTLPANDANVITMDIA